jgi:hypothetical protein
MVMSERLTLLPRSTGGGGVTLIPNGWHLSLPSGPSGNYRLAQLDDYGRAPRRRLPWGPPLTLSLRARVSAPDLPGTWGFGLWNDPFGFSLGFGGNPGRLPALPQTAWFFSASAENMLALGEAVPANGLFAGSFRSPRTPVLLLAPGLLAAPLLLLRPFSRLLRRLAGWFVRQEGALVSVDETSWHTYSINWLGESLRWEVDGRIILQSDRPPQAPLGLVLWIDNQFAAWRPDGRLGYGTLASPDAWLEITGLEVERSPST